MPFFAGLLVQVLVGGFAASIVQGIIKSLIAVGIGFVVYQGIDIVLNSINANILVNLSGVSAQLQGMLGMLKVDKCLNVLTSAYACRLIIKGVVNGVSRSFDLK